MKRQKINHVIHSDSPIHNLLVKGWVRTRRNSKGFSFIELNDGSCLSSFCRKIAFFLQTRHQVVKTTFTIQAVAFKMSPIRVEKSKISRFLDAPHPLAPTPSFFSSDF
jgi:aspartyl/asparaginyl-tRNA synthetase